jgi:hypothetical protein
MAEKRLSDADGKLVEGVLGTLIVGDGILSLADGFYIAKTVLSTGSGLPTGQQEQYGFFASTASETKPALGEDVYPITFEDICSAQNVSLDFTKAELDATTLCDTVKIYLVGRTDVVGSFDGVTIIGDSTTKGTKEITKKFMDTVTQNADLSEVEISTLNNNPIFFQVEVNKKSTKNENEAFYFFPVTLVTYTAGMTQDSTQTFTSSFRITTDDNVKPQYFELEQSVV